MLSGWKNIELFWKVTQQTMVIKKIIKRRTAPRFFPDCWAAINNMIQKKINKDHNDNVRKYLLQKISLLLFILFSIFCAFPSQSQAKESETLRTVTTSQNIVLCRTGRLTDIVIPEKVLKVVMSDSSDFKIVTSPYQSQTHLVLKPLKESTSSDLFVFGVNHVYYLRVKTVEKGILYSVHVGIRGYKAD